MRSDWSLARRMACNTICSWGIECLASWWFTAAQINTKRLISGAVCLFLSNVHVVLAGNDFDLSVVHANVSPFFVVVLGGNWTAQKSFPKPDLISASLEATSESAAWTEIETPGRISASPPTPLGPSSAERPASPSHVSLVFFVAYEPLLWKKNKIVDAAQKKERI